MSIQIVNKNLHVGHTYRSLAHAATVLHTITLLEISFGETRWLLHSSLDDTCMVIDEPPAIVGVYGCRMSFCQNILITPLF